MRIARAVLEALRRVTVRSMARSLSDMARPLWLAAPRRDGDRLEFRAGSAEIVVDGPVDVLLEALGGCDGRRTVAEILGSAPSEDRDGLRDLLGALFEAEVLVDRREAFRLIHHESGLASTLLEPMAEPPPAWRPPEDDLVGAPVPVAGPQGGFPALAHRRESAWRVSGRRLSKEDLDAVLTAAYGRRREGRSAVPSAGALSPLILHVALCSEQAGLAAGLWWFDPDQAALRRRDDDGDLRPLFITPDSTQAVLDGAAGMLVISADTERTSARYGGRAYRYMLIEAGAAMQNALLAATERELPCRPFGLFDDAALARRLGVPATVMPLLGITLG